MGPPPMGTGPFGQPQYGPGHTGPQPGFTPVFGVGPQQPPAKKSRVKWYALAAVVAVIAVVGGTAPLWWPTNDTPPAEATVRPELAVSQAAGTTCAVFEKQLQCWGMNGSGQLGNGTTAARYTPAVVAGLTKVTSVSLGGYNDTEARRYRVTACATAEEKAYCWGSNSLGEVGDGAKSDRSAPHEIAGLDNVSAVVTDWGSTCAIAKNDGDDRDSVYCWGWGKYGTLGTGTTEDRAIPAKVQLPAAAEFVAIRSGTVCAGISGGDLYCWGVNDDGQVGDGTRAVRSTPVKVQNLKNVTGVSIGHSVVTEPNDSKTEHTAICAITVGKLYCWGYGIGKSPDATIPNEVTGVPGPTQVSVDVGTACVIGEEGKVFCWGNNSYGQTGNGQKSRDEHVDTPTLVSGVRNVVSVDESNSATCAMQADDQLYCWGLVSSEDTEGVTTPQRVVLG